MKLRKVCDIQYGYAIILREDLTHAFPTVEHLDNLMVETKRRRDAEDPGA